MSKGSTGKLTPWLVDCMSELSIVEDELRDGLSRVKAKIGHEPKCGCSICSEIEDVIHERLSAFVSKRLEEFA